MTGRIACQTITAPDFTAAPYPSRGKRLGPAWQAVWDELHERDEASGADLADLMCDTAPGLTRKVALALLDEACTAGWVYGRRPHRYATRAATWYRLTHAAQRIGQQTNAKGAAQSSQDAMAGTGTLGSPVRASGADGGGGNRHGRVDA